MLFQRAPGLTEAYKFIPSDEEATELHIRLASVTWGIHVAPGRGGVVVAEVVAVADSEVVPVSVVVEIVAVSLVVADLLLVDSKRELVDSERLLVDLLKELLERDSVAKDEVSLKDVLEADKVLVNDKDELDRVKVVLYKVVHDGVGDSLSVVVNSATAVVVKMASADVLLIRFWPEVLVAASNEVALTLVVAASGVENRL